MLGTAHPQMPPAMPQWHLARVARDRPPVPSAVSQSRGSCRSRSASRLPGPGRGRHRARHGTFLFLGSPLLRCPHHEAGWERLVGNRIGELRLSRKEVLERGVGRNPLPISQTNQGGRISLRKAFVARCPHVCPARHSEHHGSRPVCDTER